MKMSNLFVLFIKTFVVVLNFVSFNEAFYPKSQNIHEFMTVPELGFYFGTSHRGQVSEYQVVYMPALMLRAPQVDEEGNPEEVEPVEYGFNAFGRRVDLKLSPNNVLVAPNFKLHRRVTEEGEPEELKFDGGLDCHYLHRDGDTVAAISSCQDQIIHGLVFLDNSTLEIRPLSPRLKTFVRMQEALEEEMPDGLENINDGVPHIVRRATLNPDQFEDDFLPFPKELAERIRYEEMRKRDESNYETLEEEDVEENEHFRRKRAPKSSKYTVELSMFFDEAGYNIFAPYMKNNDKEIRDMLLAYMNGVQALYHHPSLGTSVELSLVRMDLLKKQPSDLPHYNGERGSLLDSFCAYQKKINPPGDSDPNHWDMALYVSGLDFYAVENGRKSGVTMGLATVGGVCIDEYACVIAELGTTNAFGKPYPSAGFTSVFILAHEIGHNLGMHHDSSGNSCSKDGFIMSPSRGTNGETVWSKCSSDVMNKLGSYKCLLDKPGKHPKELDHNQFGDTPGQRWGAKRQCEVLLRDKDARASLAGGSLADICKQLDCKTPHRSGYYHAGPALEGTDCGKGLWCQGGDCVKMIMKKPSMLQGGWGSWTVSECTSGCINKGQGFQTRRRTCDNPVPINTDEGCDGSSYQVNLCKDEKICKKKKRISVGDYATNKCKEFSKRLPALDPKGSGLQAPHEESRLWMACAIFCKRSDTGSFYTPRIDLNDLGVDPYFPDGTWCHSDGKESFYCIQHHCLPESFKFSKLWGTLGEDVPLPNNARPHTEALPPAVQRYLSLGADGRPLLTSLQPGQAPHPFDEDWTDHDYLELPSSVEEENSFE